MARQRKPKTERQLVEQYHRIVGTDNTVSGKTDRYRERANYLLNGGSDHSENRRRQADSALRNAMQRIARRKTEGKGQLPQFEAEGRASAKAERIISDGWYGRGSKEGRKAYRSRMMAYGFGGNG